MARSVLITGGCGFIGRHVTRELLEHGYRVRVLDSLVEQVHGEAQPPRDPRADHVIADIRDGEAMKAALQDIDDVVHLASEVGVGQSMYEIARYVSANEFGTATLLEAMIGLPIQRIVVASSMSVYGEGRYRDRDGAIGQPDPGHRRTAGNWDPLDGHGQRLTPAPTDEEKPVDLASIYALNKYMQERAVLIFAAAYGMEAAALRLFNVYGAGQSLSNPYTGVLANFASRIANGQPPTIFEDGHQRRDFVHVDDVARAFRLALERPGTAGQVFNIGSGVSRSILEIARLLADAMGRPDLEPEVLDTARSGDIRHCFADISKARAMLGYAPRETLEHALEPFVTWVASNTAIDRNAEMRRHLEARGLVA